MKEEQFLKEYWELCKKHDLTICFSKTAHLCEIDRCRLVYNDGFVDFHFVDEADKIIE